MSKSTSKEAEIVVIGAGIGGLTTAAALSRKGANVTVLEAQVIPGGCASTFYHQGYRFDAGATLAGGFNPGGPMELVAQATGVPGWTAHPIEPAMVVHLPDGQSVRRWGDDRRREELRKAFDASAERFWEWQERTADAMWELALVLPPWLPQTFSQLFELGKTGSRWIADEPRERLRLEILLDAARPLSHRLDPLSESLRLFVDAQLLISAQTTSKSANALYGAAALDLPRRGVVNFEGGIGAIAQTLVHAITHNGGRVLFRKEASRILTRHGRPVGVETRHSEHFPAHTVIVNLPPENIAKLLDPERQIGKPPHSEHGWGAFMVYIGLDETMIPASTPLHQQVVRKEPMGEGNTLFLSLSPGWDRSRAPLGQRVATLSTHTDLRPWWQDFLRDKAAYEARKELLLEKVLETAEVAIPGIRKAARLVLPGTPVTFQRFTRRAWGMVGGYPQTSLLRSNKPRLAPGVWMVGDSIFPGQSIPATALGGLRVANMLLDESPAGMRLWSSLPGRSSNIYAKTTP